MEMSVEGGFLVRISYYWRCWDDDCWWWRFGGLIGVVVKVVESCMSFFYEEVC